MSGMLGAKTRAMGPSLAEKDRVDAERGCLPGNTVQAIRARNERTTEQPDEDTT